ncbi:MAG TPA: HD domain-containing protein [Vicinamibacterales bacterium]|nr:HD domain-containing protein [Vicinamibacterales bacterium]
MATDGAVLPGGAAPLLEQARRAAGRDILAGESGLSALERYSAFVDRELQRLAAAADVPATPVALIALGGYGRRHLCPYSDIDLLVLFGGVVGDGEERFLRRLLHPLWDAGFVVGHQVREAREIAELEVDNPEFLMALSDARLVAGEASLFRRLLESFHVPATHAHIVEALQELIDARYAQFNATLYQLEPDVKEAPGALRDIAAARTISAATDPAMLRRSGDAPRLAQAEDFLLRIRALLHLERRRNDNILVHELQEKIARQLGYPGQSPRQQVEALMADYFSHARTVTRALDRVRRTAPVPVGVNLGRTRDGVRFIDEGSAALDPESWLAAFQSALDGDTGVADETLEWIRQHGEGCSFASFFPAAEHRAALLRFLVPRRGLYARLSEMHDCGLLGRMIPPFHAITYRVVRDFYHKYTVDEHTLQTIRNLERLVSAPDVRPRFSALLREIEAPELLVLSLLLHDVGKWRDDDHAIESVRMAEGFLAQLELPDAARETVRFLIRHHLRMSQVAFRRDTEDPEIVREFAALVATEDRLKLLCLMTLADVEAVSPDTLTRWKEELLWRVYVDTYNCLTRQYGDDLIDRTETAAAECVARRPADLAAGEVAAFLEGLPRRYLQLFDRRTVYDHVRLARDMHPDEVHLRLEPADAVWELTVVTLDKPMLFANICGVLSSFGMDILRGHAMTNPNGLVLDVFQFVDAERFLALNPGASDAVLHAIEDVVGGRSTAADRLRGRLRGLQRRRAARAAPVVGVDGDASRKYTVLEIVAPDELGLLYRISRAISEYGCEIDLVLIATEGDTAIDVFHITRRGDKLTPADQQGLTAHLQHMLEDNE